MKEDGVDNSSELLSCPLCLNQFVHAGKVDNGHAAVFGYGLDFRVVPRDCDNSGDVALCPNCFYAYRVEEFNRRVPGNVKDLVRSRSYTDLYASASDPASRRAQAWLGYVAILERSGLNPRDLGLISLKGAWAARELCRSETEEALLSNSNAYLEDALRRGLVKGNPGLAIYLLGEINRRRGDFRRSKEMLTFLGNNPRYRYPALLLTVLVEEEDSVPYWSKHSPDRMEHHSPRFKGLFPALRSIPPGKTQFFPDELSEQSEQSEQPD
jgi:uncharacterized protein (DUF2225 family)